MIEEAFGGELGKDLVDGLGDFVAGTEVFLLGLDQTVEAGAGEGQGAHGAEDFGEGFSLAALLDQAADEDAHERDLGGEPGGVKFFEVGEVEAGEEAGVEAVF